MILLYETILRFVNSKKHALKIGAERAAQGTRYESHFWPHTAVQVQTLFLLYFYVQTRWEVVKIN